MSDSSWLLSSEPDSIDDAELPSSDIAIDEPVESSSDADYLGEAFAEEAIPAPASDEWKKMRATADGQKFGQDIYNRNAYQGPIGLLNNGIIYQQIGATSLPGRKASSTTIDQEWLAKNGRVHIRSPRYRDALELLIKRRVVVLVCEQHTGKQCAALNLLAARNLEELRSIDPDIDLADDQSFTFAQRRGYLIDGLSPASFQKLTTYTFDRLANDLKAQDSYLAVTLNAPALPGQSLLSDYAILWDAVPDRALILQQHLAWYLKDETLRPSALQRCEEPQVKRVLNELSPVEIDTLAKLLADVEFGKLATTEEALRKFVADPITRIADWFRIFTSLEESTFLIALAVLSGARYQSITAAAAALHVQITNASESPLLSTAAFDRTRINLLREINARIILSEENARFGRVLAERVELDKHEYRAALLAYIWREYDGLRKPLLDWLRKLGLNNVPGVRELAAGAVAKFAQYDLGDVRWAVLQHWAKHADNRVRRAAALTIALLASEPQFSPYALDLLENWSLLRNNRRLCWTAAAAYGGLLDAQFWDVALRGLGNVAETGDAHLLHVINRGVANLFQAAQGQLLACAHILDTLETWTLNSKKSMSIGLLIFLNLAQLDTPEEPSALLQLSASPECGMQIRTLWRRALNHAAARPKAVIALRSWLGAADSDPAFFGAAQQLIADLVASGDQREQQRLDYWLNRWANDPKQPCSSAARIRGTA